MRRLKILAVSDQVVPTLYSPNLVDRFGDIDLIMSCGDLPYDYLEYIVTLLNKPMYYVHGNHDLDMEYTESGQRRVALQGGESLDLRSVVGPQGLLLAGLEGSIRYDPRSRHQYTQSEMNGRARQLSLQLVQNRLRYGRCLDILVTHAPPFNIGDGADPAHIGFRAINTLIHRFKPKLLLHGHQHIYRGPVPEVQVEATRVINVFPYRLIEWEDEHVG